MKLTKGVLCILFALSTCAAGALEMDTLKVQRKEVFEFTEKPKVTREGDKVTISFASKDFCDATVAIEDAQGNIVRHLASGVLGPNAPAPFQKDPLKQTLVWDGKNDKEEYVDDKDSHTVRVSLGLKPQFERTLFWSAKKKGGLRSAHWIRATPEGVYVVFPGEQANIRLFDHDARYIRTVFPFPSAQIDRVVGLPMRQWPPDGRSFPFRDANGRLVLIGDGPPLPPSGADSPARPAAPATPVVDGVWELASHEGWLHMIGTRLKRLAKDGSSGGRPFRGPDVSATTELNGKFVPAAPLSAAMSPDGKWLYLAGYGHTWVSGGWGYSRMLHGVMRVDPNGDAKPELFAGDMEKEGTDAKHFDQPRGVLCDAKGRVLVADYNNDRIQVFAADGKLQKSIPIWKPTVMRIDPKTGELYVFSWRIGGYWETNHKKWDQQDPKRPPSLTVMASVDDPTVRAAYPLDVPSPIGTRNEFEFSALAGAYADIDFWAAGGVPRIWIVNDCGADERTGPMALRVYEPRDRKLALVHDFDEEAAKEICRVKPPYHSHWRLFCNPKNGKLYVAEHSGPQVIIVKGFYDLVQLDPNTGKGKIVDLPFDAEDMGFDLDGHAYLRTADMVARYDADTWREVPFDYGEQRPISYQGLKTAQAISAITFAGGGNASSQLGGMCVSPKGHVAVHVCNPNEISMTPEQKKERGIHTAMVKKYEPQIFPGRAVSTLIHVFDRHGKVLYEDAVAGVGYSDGIALDKDDNLYQMAAGLSNYDGKAYPERWTCSLVKMRPNTKVLSGGPIPLPEAQRPKRLADLVGWRDNGAGGQGGESWIEKAEWVFGGVGIDTQGPAGRGACHCTANSRFALDYFGRSFAPEIQRFDVVVIDSAGNAIVRVGRYGNVDDGAPSVKDGGPPAPRPMGGDEVALLNPRYVATHTDRRLFIADRVNERILSVKLGYHASEKVALKDVKDQK